MANPNIQTSTQQEEPRFPVSWIYSLSKENLEANLNALKLDSSGSVDELRTRFRDFLKSRSSILETTSPGASNQNMTQAVQSNVSTTCDKVRKWSLNFDGKGDAVSFLERISELQDCYNIKDGDMLTALPLVFRNDALLWFRNAKSNWSCWENFIDDFKVQYMHPRYDRQIEDEIRARHQRPREDFKDYLTAMSTLMRRGKAQSDSDKYDRVYNNMRPEYKLYIHRDSAASIKKLAERASEYEQILQEQRKVVPCSSNNEKSNQDGLGAASDGLHNTAHSNNALLEYNECYDSRVQIPQAQQQQISPTTTKLSNPSKRCWRCAQMGHVRNGCRNQAKLFCGRCGRVDILAKHCKCQEATKKMRYTVIDDPEFSVKQVTTTNQSSHTQSRDDRRIWADINIGGIIQKCLCDSGASSSFISKEMADMLQGKGMQCQQDCLSKICLADGRIVNSLGKMRLPTYINGHKILSNFLVMPETEYQVVLGVDVLEAFGAVIDIREKKVTFNTYQDENSHETYLSAVNTIPENNAQNFSTGKRNSLKIAKGRITGVKHVNSTKPDTASEKQSYYPYRIRERETNNSSQGTDRRVNDRISRDKFSSSNSARRFPIPNQRGGKRILEKPTKPASKYTQSVSPPTNSSPYQSTVSTKTGMSIKNPFNKSGLYPQLIPRRADRTRGIASPHTESKPIVPVQDSYNHRPYTEYIAPGEKLCQEGYWRSCRRKFFI